MRFGGDVHQGRFVRRLTRFSGEVHVGRTRVFVHIPNSGRLRELLVAGRRVLLRRQERGNRKTAYDLLSVALGRRWVCVDARLPPRLVEEAVGRQRVPRFEGYRVGRREIKLGNGRIDLLLQGVRGYCYTETKAVTLVVNRTAVFPDAPTLRGTRHLRSLLRARRRGMRSAVIFVVQRADARRFTPNWKTDPTFARTLVEAAEAGVLVLAYACAVNRVGIEIAHSLAVHLVPGDDDAHARA